MLQRSEFVHKIPGECGRSYIGEKGRSLDVRLKEHKYNLKGGLCDRSKLAANVFEEGHRIVWYQTEVLQVEFNSVYRKYK
jgi:hypothetical protein